MPVTRARAKGNGNAAESVSPPKARGVVDKPLTRAMSKKQVPPLTTSSPPSKKNKSSGSCNNEKVAKNVRPKRAARTNTVESEEEEPKAPRKRATRQKKIKATAETAVDDAKMAEELRVQQMKRFTNLLNPEGSWHKKVMDTIVGVDLSLAAKRRAAKELLADRKGDWVKLNGHIVATHPNPVSNGVKSGAIGQAQNGYEHEEGVNGNADDHREVTSVRRQPGRTAKAVKTISVAARNSETSAKAERSLVVPESVQVVDEIQVEVLPVENGELKNGKKRQRERLLSLDKPQHQFQLVIPDTFNFNEMNNGSPVIPVQPMKKLHLEFNHITTQEVQVIEEVLASTSVTVEESVESKENKPHEVDEKVILPVQPELKNSRETYCFTPPAPVTVKKKLPASQLVTASVTEIVQASCSRRETYEVVPNKQLEQSNSDPTPFIQDIQPAPRKTFDIAAKSNELSAHSESTVMTAAEDAQPTPTETNTSGSPNAIANQVPSDKMKEKLSLTYTVNKTVEISFLTNSDDDEPFVDANSTFADGNAAGNNTLGEGIAANFTVAEGIAANFTLAEGIPADNDTLTFDTRYETAYEDLMSTTALDNETIAFFGNATKCQTLYPPDNVTSEEEDDESVEMEFENNPGPSSLMGKPIRNSVALYKKILSEPVRDINESLFVAGELEENSNEESTGEPKSNQENGLSSYDESNNYEISRLEEAQDDKQMHRLNKKIPLWATDGAHLEGQLYLGNPFLLEQVMEESEELNLTDDDDEHEGEKNHVDLCFPPCNTFYKLFPGVEPPRPRK